MGRIRGYCEVFSPQLQVTKFVQLTMEPMAWGRVTEQVLRENIALLELLGKEHKKPAANLLAPDFRERNSSFSRQLTIERERDLIDTFAFLSASSGDPDQVIAVCIEEQQDGKSMTVRISANSGDMRPRKKVLKRIVSTLEHIASEGGFRRPNSCLIG